MGKKVYTGRYTSEQDKDVVVFMIGMRINKLWAIHKWLPVLKAMPPMIRELYTNKEYGFITAENFIGLRTTLMVQYWHSSDELLAYAKAPKHLTAWREFNKRIGDNDAVGIYHETYVVSSTSSESFYGNMPKFGLAKALGHQVITPSMNSARKRFNT